MTDNSNAAPERIWAWPNDVEDGFMAASMVNEPPTLEYGDGSHVEYIRADLACAQIAAAYERAERALWELLCDDRSEFWSGHTKAVKEGIEAMKSLADMARTLTQETGE